MASTTKLGSEFLVFAVMYDFPMIRPTTILLALALAVAVGSGAHLARAQDANEATDRVQRHRAARLYVRGLTQARDGNHQAAIDLFSEASRSAPDEAAIFLSLSEAHHALEQNDIALFYAGQAVRIDDSAPYLHHLARAYLKTGDAEKALETYDQLLEREDVDTDAVFEAARLMVHLSRDADAASAFERLIRMVGDDRILRTQLLQLYGRLDDDAGVERTLQALIRLQPATEHYYLLLSDFYQRNEMLGKAVDILESGLRNAEDAYDISSDLISLYRRNNKPDRADSLAASLTDVEDLTDDQLARRAERAYARATTDPGSVDTAISLLTRAIESSPGDVALLIMLGDLHFSNGRFADAAQLLERALAKDVRNGDLWLQTALAHLNAGEIEDAARTADDGVVLFPGRVEMFVVGGHANMQLYRNTKAIELFTTALELMADDELWDRQLATESHAALGFLYSRRKNHSMSDDHYRRAIRIDSTNTFALNNFAYSLAERGVDLAEANDMARRAVLAEPDNPSFLDTAGWISFRLGDLDSAYDFISRAVDTGRASATVHRHLGDVLETQGRSVEARQSWQRGLEINPDDPELKKRLAQPSP